jgi:MFS family permease
VAIAGQRSFAALHHPGYRAYFACSALSMMADSIEHVISYWILFEKFQSPALGGVAILTHWLPFLFFSVYSGALADRFDPKKVMLAGVVLFMLASLGWGVLFYTDALEQWHAMVLLVIHGLAGVLWQPASQLIVHDIVGHKELQSAVRLMSTARYLGILLGAAVGAVLMLLAGPALGILLNILVYLPLFIWLLRAPYGAAPAPGTRHSPAGLASILPLVREVSSNRTIVFMTLLAGAASLFVGNAYQAQMPEFAHHLGHADAGMAYSMLLSADAAGALVAGLVLESRSLLPVRERTAFILTMLWCLAIAGFAASDNYLLALGMLFIAGFLSLAASAMSQTLVQLAAPEHLRGRIVGLYNMSGLGMRAFSGVTVGVLGALIGIHWSLALSAMALLALTAVLLGLSHRR